VASISKFRREPGKDMDRSVMRACFAVNDILNSACASSRVCRACFAVNDHLNSASGSSFRVCRCVS
jgi:hypothetical protein